jgi:hypothetical protein
LYSYWRDIANIFTKSLPKLPRLSLTQTGLDAEHRIVTGILTITGNGKTPRAVWWIPASLLAFDTVYAILQVCQRGKNVAKGSGLREIHLPHRLGEGQPCTWRTRLIEVAAEIVVRARRVVVRLASSWPYLDHYQEVAQAVLACSSPLAPKSG